MTLSEIIARLESATGPDRGLDIAIYCTINERPRSGYVDAHAPAYTASVDAALTLVPEGWHWTVCDTDGTEKSFAAVQIEPPSYSSAPFCGSAPIPAITLCIASLKARSAP